MSVRVDRGHLFLDFRHRGQRYREYLNLEDTPDNRRWAQVRDDLIAAEIRAGSFDYARHFPNSKRVVVELARRSDDVEIPEGILRSGADRTPCVYVVQMGEDGPVKIGWTAELRARLRNLQSANPTRLRLLAAFSGSRDLEWSMQRRVRSSAIRGEWFHPTAEVRQLLDDLAKEAAPTSRATA